MNRILSTARMLRSNIKVFESAQHLRRARLLYRLLTLTLLVAALISISMRNTRSEASANPQARNSDAFEWTAQWIWPSIRNISPHANQFIRFRKEFVVADVPTSAQIRVFADSRYHLYVNGILVARGPARAPLYWGYYDTIAVGRLLHPGKNVIAAEVRWLDAPMGWYREPPGAPNHGGLVCQLDYESPTGHHTVISDPTWTTSEDDSMIWGQPRINGSLPEVEVVRADHSQPDWTGEDFDDSHWFHAQVTTTQFGLSTPPAEPFSNLERRPMASPIEELMAPQSIVSYGLTSDDKTLHTAAGRRGTALMIPSTIANLGHFIATEPHNPSARLLDYDDILVGKPTEKTAVLLPHSAPAYVIFDMGREVDGYPQITIDAPANTVIDLGWSERLTDGHVDADQPGGNYVARYYARAGSQKWTLWGWHGLRYLEVRVSPSTVPIHLRADLLFSTADLSHDGSLHTSNPELNDLWQMGAYTWQLCTLDGVMDCPTREQREWVGDGELELLVNSVTDGNLDIARKFLLDVARDQRQDGAIPSVAASGVSDIWVIDDYMFSFVNVAHEYYFETGDRRFLALIYPNIVRIMQWFKRLQQPDGYLGKMPYWVFLDWSMPDKRGTSAILNALYMHALENAADLAQAMNNATTAADFERRASAIRQSWHHRYWNAERGLYMDTVDDGKQSEQTGQLVNADAVLFNLAPQRLVPAILSRITDPHLVKAQSLDSTTLQLVQPDGAIDYHRDIVQAQPYGMYFVLSALVKSGWDAEAVSTIEHFWGPMRAAGNGTFWEQFRQANGTSCHAWSATPTYILSRVLLGVKETAPGFQSMTIAPKPLDLKWANGTVPTPRGVVSVLWIMRSSPVASFSLHIDLPFASRTRIVLPEWQGHRPHRIVVNGNGAVEPLILAKPGKYDIEVGY